MEKEKRMTKKDYFNELKTIVEDSKIENKDELIYFLESQIESIENKAIKAKERAAEKKANGDEIRDLVKSALTKELQSVEDIVATINKEDITKAKVIARLTQLVNLGEAIKENTKIDAKQKMMYRLA